MPTKPETNKRLNFSVPVGYGVDRAAGILTNVSLITAMREAKGHGLYIDAETLAPAKAAVDSRGGRLKGALRHLSWDEYFANSGDRVLDFPGWFSGIDVKGEQLAAGKFEFFESFRTDEAKTYNRMIEMAEKTPDLFGLSIEVWGYAVYVATDGKEFGQRPEGLELKYDGLPALRVTDLTFAAFVDEPAANDGLFAKFSAQFSRVFGGKQGADATAVRELAASLSAWAEKQTAAGAKDTVPSPPTTEPRHEKLSAMQIIQTIKAEFSAKPAQFSQAMTILGNKPDITIEALRAEMVSADLRAASEQVTLLTSERDGLKTMVTNLTAERDDFKKKFDELKASGNLHEVNLGAGNGGGGTAGGANPWAPATINFTQQCEIESKNPTLAATLKADAAKLKK